MSNRVLLSILIGTCLVHAIVVGDSIGQSRDTRPTEDENPTEAGNFEFFTP